MSANNINNTGENVNSNLPAPLTMTVLTGFEEIQEWRKKLESFLKFLHKKPDQNQILKHKKFNFPYIPIGAVEKKLDTLFFGLWQTRNFHWDRFGNEIFGSIELWVLHPVTNTWLCREGAGAVQIRFRENSDFTDPVNKIQTALQMDFPHLRAECLKNAAASLGDGFGRDLRRDYHEEYEGIIKDKPTMTEEQNVYFTAEKMEIESYTEAEKLKDDSKVLVKDFYRVLPKFAADELAALINAQFTILQTNSKKGQKK